LSRSAGVLAGCLAAVALWGWQGAVALAGPEALAGPGLLAGCWVGVRLGVSAGGTTAELGRGLTGHPGEGAGEGSLVVEAACGSDLGDRGRGGGQRLGGRVDARP